MHNITDMLCTLGEIVYHKDSMPTADIMALNITGARINNDLHMIFIKEGGNNAAQCPYVITKIYEAFYAEKIWNENIELFEKKYDIDFVTLISYIYVTNDSLANTESSIAISLAIAKILATVS